MKYDLVSFDMDGTLITEDFSNTVWGDGLPSMYAEEYEMNIEDARRETIDEIRALGNRDMRWYDLPYWISKFSLSYEDDAWATATKMVHKYRSRVTPIEKTVLMLEEALRSGCRVIVISNAWPMFLEVGLGKYAWRFEKIFSTTFDYGFHEVKSPRLFRAICCAMGVDPEKALHIGNDKYFDGVCPIVAGMDAKLVEG